MKKPKGFVLIELLVCLSIIGILFAIIASTSGSDFLASGDGEKVGKIVDVSFKGVVCHTWEGEMILGGQGTVTQSVWHFSVKDPNIVLELQKARDDQTGEVKLRFHKNRLIRPWKGGTTYFVTAVIPFKPRNAEKDAGGQYE